MSDHNHIIHPLIQGGNVSVVCSRYVWYKKLDPSDNREAMTNAKRVPLWMISGTGETMNNGSCTLFMNKLLTYPLFNDRSIENIEGRITDPNPTFLVSPLSDTPVVLTKEIKIEEFVPYGQPYLDYYDLITKERLEESPNAYRIEITVKSWNLEGAPEGYKLFSWVFFAAGALQYTPPM
jgi:hypothetical protein